MRDRLVTASAADGTVALVAGITTNLVAETRERHGTSPTASVAIGRLVTAAALVGANLKGRERLSLQVSGSGTIGGIIAEVMMLPDHTVGARAYAHHPEADVPPTSDGRFNVAELVGRGKLLVTKSYEVGQPYTGIVNLVTGEIASDVAAYFAYSEQVPERRCDRRAPRSVRRARRGRRHRARPPRRERRNDRNSRETMPTPWMQSRRRSSTGVEPEGMIERIAAGMTTKRSREYDVIFACRCTREKVETALLGLGHDELVKIAQEQPTTEATCEFCKRVWKLSASEVSRLGGADPLSTLDAHEAARSNR